MSLQYLNQGQKISLRPFGFERSQTLGNPGIALGAACQRKCWAALRQISFVEPVAGAQSTRERRRDIPRPRSPPSRGGANRLVRGAVLSPSPHDKPRSSRRSAGHRAIFRRAAYPAAAQRLLHRTLSRGVYGVNPRMRSRAERARRAPPREPRVHRVVRPLCDPGRYASLMSPPRFMVAFSGINLVRICPSMSLAISGCCCKNVRALSLPCPMRSPL